MGIARCILITLALLGAVPWAQASVFSRSDDTRPLPPERWPDWSRYGVDLRLGGAVREGNVDQVQLNGALAAKWKLRPTQGFFLSGEGSYARFADKISLDKTAASALYALDSIGSGTSSSTPRTRGTASWRSTTGRPTASGSVCTASGPTSSMCCW